MKSFKISKLTIICTTIVGYLAISLYLDVLSKADHIQFYQLWGLFILSTLGITWSGWLGAYSIYRTQTEISSLSEKENINTFFFMLNQVQYLMFFFFSYGLLSVNLKTLDILVTNPYEETVKHIFMIGSYLMFYLSIRHQNRYNNSNSTIIDIHEAITFIGTALIGMSIWVSLVFDMSPHSMDIPRLVFTWILALISLLWCGFIGGFYYFSLSNSIKKLKNKENKENSKTIIYHIWIASLYLVTNCIILIKIGQNKLYYSYKDRANQTDK